MKAKITLFACVLCLTQGLIAQCNFIYVTPNGLPTGLGSMNDPMDITTAFNTAPSGSYIRMATGTYALNSALTLNGQNITVEGGFIDSLAWTKTSLAGATTLLRNGTNPTGPNNAPRISALELVSRSGFRFQDLTIQTANAPSATQAMPYGVTVYGVYLDSCSSYDFVRCQIIAGNASAGFNGTVGANGVNGGNGSQGSSGSCNGNYTCCFGSESAPGGNGGQGGQGGAGVSGGASNNSTSNNNPGTTGTGRNGGGGGAGGKGGGFNCGGCTSAVAGSAGGGSASAGTNNTVGQPGAQGDPGGDGTAGTAGIAGVAGALGAQGIPGVVTGGFWSPGAQAPNGGDGTGGQGGSGGGGGGRQTCALCDDGPGNGGAGGGGGGQGGQGGTGGYGGGASFGLFINFNGQGGSLMDCFVQAGTQGSGGVGANGGAGGNGGTGGTIQSTCSSEIGDGAPGGNGGAGGAGGKGGNGAAGISQGVYRVAGDTLLTHEDAFNLQAQQVIHVSYAMCSNATMQAQALNANTVAWSFMTPANTLTASTNPASFSSGNVGFTTVSAQINGISEMYTEFIQISCNGQTTNQSQSVCQGEQVLFNGSYLTQSGTYTDTLTNAQGCDSIVVLQLTVHQVNNTISINPSNGQQLLSSNTTGLTYQWLNCTTGTNLPGANGSSLLVTQNGTYAVVSTDANGCKDTSNCITINYIGLNELNAMAFSVAPNPVLNEITVTFNEGFSGRIYLTDVTGKRVFENELFEQKEWVATLNVPKGIYFLNAENTQGIKTIRMVKD